MAQPPSLTSVPAESFKEAPTWFKTFIGQLNPFISDVTSALTGGLDSQNLSRQVTTFSVTTRGTLAETFAKGRVSIKNTLGRTPVHLSLSVAGVSGGAIDYTTEQWVSPLLLNSWLDVGGATLPVGYYMDGSGFVSLRGAVKNGVTASGTVLFNLPAGYRPAGTCNFPVASFGAYGEVAVSAAGDVTLSNGNAGYVALDNVRFQSAIGSGIGVGTPQWQPLNNGLVKINYIPGLRVNTKYDFTAVLE